MKPSPLIPAAEYVRMSTDQQDYSIPHQQYAIANYAAVQRLKVVKSYADAGKSGLDLRHRPGLQSLLRDVASGNPGFNVILVYDVSRWGAVSGHRRSGAL
jgi:DNA invertase Pin-like site-specific DNA recombinase